MSPIHRACQALLGVALLSISANAAEWKRVWDTGRAPVMRVVSGGGRAYAWAVSTENAFGRSIGGEVWSDTPGMGWFEIRLDSQNPDCVWIVQHNGLFRSHDAGATFQRVNVPVRESYLAALAVNDGGAVVIGAMPDPQRYDGLPSDQTSPGGTFSSSDGGVSWRSTGLQGLYVTAFYSDGQCPETLYARTEVGGDPSHRPTFYRSMGDAVHWEAFSNREFLYLQSDPHDCRRMAAKGESQSLDYLLRSWDGGASWYAQWPPPLFDEPYHPFPVLISALVADPNHPGVLYIATQFHGVHRSTDDGWTWELLGLKDVKVNDLSLDGSTGVLYAAAEELFGGAAGVYRLVDAAGDPALLPWFTMNRLTVPPGEAITFTDLTKGNVVTHTWDFGDGTTSSEPSPSHTYARGGTFTVILTVSDGTETKSIRRSVVIKPTRARPVR